MVPIKQESYVEMSETYKSALGVSEFSRARNYAPNDYGKTTLPGTTSAP